MEEIKIQNNPEASQGNIDALTVLNSSNGWKIIVKALETRIKHIDLKLHGQIDVEKTETIENLQHEWSNLNALKDIPQELIEDFKKKPEEMKELDVYD